MKDWMDKDGDIHCRVCGRICEENNRDYWCPMNHFLPERHGRQQEAGSVRGEPL